MTSLAKGPAHGLWRRSASLLLLGPGKHGRPSVLTVKRSAKAKFMPNNVVFPGGLCETADFSLSWLNSFPELARFTVDPRASYPDIFVNDSDQPHLEELSPHVGFRITALRELVEEAGVLLDHKSGSALTLSDEVRKIIHQHPERFCDILKDLGLAPDIWALHDWSTWLTPIGLPDSNRRYDTQFYVAILGSLEGLKPSSDNVEVSTVQFWDIGEILAASISKTIMVAPPQMYELGRLFNFSTMEELEAYAMIRDKFGTGRIFPVRVRCTDGVLITMPGDSLYPDVPDIAGKFPLLKLDLTVDECMEMYPRHHRVKMMNNKPPSIAINIELALQQIGPYDWKVKSQL